MTTPAYLGLMVLQSLRMWTYAISLQCLFKAPHAVTLLEDSYATMMS